MEINWTTVISTTAASAINSMAMYLIMRYFSRLVERIENRLKNGKDKDN